MYAAQSSPSPLSPLPSSQAWRLRKHADYQRVYKAARKQFSPSMTWFHTVSSPAATGPRVGLTAGRVLGNAVERNRIKRRMREAIRSNLHLLHPNTDLVLHPRRVVLEIKFADLLAEIERIFKKVAALPASPAARS